MNFDYCKRGKKTGKEEYVFGLKIYRDDTVIVRVTPKEDWKKCKRYSKYITEELKNAMNYLGFDFLYDEEFHYEYSGEPLTNIIKILNKCPLLEPDEDFNNYVLTYIYCIHDNEDGEIRLYITPKIYWKDNQCQDDRCADEHISKFLESVGFSEECEGSFEPIKKIDYDKLEDEIKAFKYLEYSSDFDSFIDRIY